MRFPSYKECEQLWKYTQSARVEIVRLFITLPLLGVVRPRGLFSSSISIGRMPRSSTPKGCPLVHLLTRCHPPPVGLGADLAQHPLGQEAAVDLGEVG